MNAPPTIDVLGLGCVAVDDLLYVPVYPARDSKAEVSFRERRLGGLTAAALMAAARLAARAAYAGVLGTDPLSDYAAERMSADGIDLSQLQRRADTRPIHSTIVVETASGSRTILYDLAGAVGASEDGPDEEFIRACRVLLVDPLGIDGMIRAARIARDAGIPVVADFESDQHPRFAELLSLVDHLVVSADFARLLTGLDDPAAAAALLWNDGRQAAIVTVGVEGCWCASAESAGRPRHFPAFCVQAHDTTGCGDVFHGAYAAALARGLPLEERIRFASGAAALKATAGGLDALAGPAALDQFLEQHR